MLLPLPTKFIRRFVPQQMTDPRIGDRLTYMHSASDVRTAWIESIEVNPYSGRGFVYYVAAEHERYGMFAAYVKTVDGFNVNLDLVGV